MSWLLRCLCFSMLLLSWNSSSASLYNIKKSMPVVVVVNATNISTGKVSTGTGFFIDSTYIVTNYHIVDTANHIRIKTYFHGNFFPLTATLVSYSEEFDIAILKTNMYYPHFTTLKKVEVMVGEDIFVIGNLYGLEFSVTKGNVVNKTENNSIIFVDAVIHHGNSGSPVFNYSGEVIGMIRSALYNDKNIPIGISTVIPSSVIIDNQNNTKVTDYPFLNSLEEKNLNLIKNYLQ